VGVFGINCKKLVFFLFVFFLSFSLVCAEDVSNDTLISEYQNCGDVSVEDNVMNDVKLSSENEDISLVDYYSAESDSSVDASKNDDFFC